MKSLPPIELPRSVERGSVFCPVRMGFVKVDRCTRCGYLNEAEYDADGELTEFVCSPSRAAFLAGMSI